MREDLICLRIMGWSDGRSGVDCTINASVGLPAMTGPVEDDRPVNHVLPAWDLLAGTHGAFTLLAAEREVIDNARRGVMSFTNLTFRLPGARKHVDRPSSERRSLRQETLHSLLVNDRVVSRSVAYSRILWGLLVPVSGALAFILARPPMRSSSAIGLLSGLCLLMVFLKSIALLESANNLNPAIMRFSIGLFWIAAIALLFVWHKRAGNGAIDMAALSLLSGLPKGSRR
jgi:hypothetical protein